MESEPPIQFTEPWDDTYVSGGKRLTLSKDSDKPDHFVGHGKDKSCVVSGSWYQLMVLATEVRISQNTKRVIDACGLPDWAFLSERPLDLGHWDSEYRYTDKPYGIGDTEFIRDLPRGHFETTPFADRTEVGTKPTFLQRECYPKPEGIEPDPNNRAKDNWVRHQGLKYGPRFHGNWWELMCFAVEVMSAPETKIIIDALPSEVDIPETVYIDHDTSEFEYGSKPYAFEEE